MQRVDILVFVRLKKQILVCICFFMNLKFDEYFCLILICDTIHDTISNDFVNIKDISYKGS